MFGSQVSSGRIILWPGSSFRTPCFETCGVCYEGDDRDHFGIGLSIMCLRITWGPRWPANSGSLALQGTPTYASTANRIQSGGTAKTIHPTSSKFMDEDREPQGASETVATFSIMNQRGGYVLSHESDMHKTVIGKLNLIS